jgi:hypothetical protein
MARLDEQQRPGKMTLRHRALLAAGHLAAPAVVRLAIGYWPDMAGRARFAAGFADTSLTIPPLVRGLLALPGGADLLAAAPRMPRLLPGLLAVPFGRKMLLDAVEYNWHRERGSLDPAGTPDLGGSIFTAWTGPPVAFLHFEKSGGTAAISWLSRRFHPEQIDPDPRRDLPPHLLYRAPAALPDRVARYPLLWGHYDVPSLRRIDPGRFIFTMLREPRARLLSLHHFWRSVNPEQFDPAESFSVASAHRLSLEEFLACDDPFLTDLTDNVFVRRLTGLYATGAARDPLLDSPQSALREAMRVLDTLGFVGITETMEDSLAALAARLGIAPPEAGARANVTAENHADPSGWFRAVPRAAQTPAVQALLDRRTVLDRALYAHALDRFGGPAALAAQ